MIGSWSRAKSDQKGPDTKDVTPSQEANGVTEAEDYEKALESLGRILRCLGRHSFDLEERSEEEIEKEFERWAMHVLVGMSIRGNEEEGDEGGIRRDWGELTKFVNRHRQQEKSYVNRNLQDVRNVLWEFTNTVGRAIVEDQESDQQVDKYLVQLRTATEGGSFTEVKQALLSVVQGINSVIDERKKRQQERVKLLGEKLRAVEKELGSARKEMVLDPLTRLYNRGALNLQLERTVNMSFFSETPACVFMVDIDHFKMINDTHGHPAGDAVIQQLADRLVSTFPRKSDFVARYGGEEFCVLLHGANLELCQRLGDRLLEAVRREPFGYQDLIIPATVSVGLAALRSGDTVLTWLERADHALYQAKEGGRNQLCMASELRDRLQGDEPTKSDDEKEMCQS
ncbi:MAG: GGDEF domain-containing protein [Nitrospirota bacterium]|nr:GGDEF domain-containing protein [Nitrospirota bacterium]MDH5585812.1 GGDEF domain-containing protein [Nitrospirota bacterium]